MDQTSTIPTLYTAPPTIQGGSRASTSVLPGPAAISGGLLRPGAIDQAQFKSMLRATQAQQKPNQTVEPPLAIPAPRAAQPSPFDGIPTLTPAQFAVLTGGQAEPSAPASLAAPLVSPALPAPAEAPAQPELSAPATQISGKPTPEAEPKPKAEAMATEESKPGSDKVPAKNDPRVVHFAHMPDKDERKALAASGKRWVVDETPGSRKLFFGDDLKFGWDDLADLVNPLQHIPVVAQIYRAVTGDQINGAAELLGALPFGPSSFITSVADLAVRESTGKDMGSNVLAMLFGHDRAPAGETPAGDTPAGETPTGGTLAGITAAPAGLAATADANGVTANTIQTAFIQPSPGGGGRDNGGRDL